MQNNRPIILFDGICNLCNGSIDFIVKRDRDKQFRFVPLQSEEGKSLIQKFKIPVNSDSVILIDSETVYFESDAVMQIAGKLPNPWKMVKAAKFIPLKIRNAIYRIIAKNRYRWFGKRENCRILTQE